MSTSLPTFPTRLRQIALITPSPIFPQTAHLLPHIFGAPIIYRDPAVNQWGIENFLLALGGDVIEVCSHLPQNWPSSRAEEKGGLDRGDGSNDTEEATKLRLSTPVGRLLSRRGEGGYMIIMQSSAARTIHTQISSGGRGPPRQVIFSHPFEFSYPLPQWTGYGVKDRGICVQYHPKGVKGGMMPEVDGHETSTANRDPLGERFSPWHPCGGDYRGYGEMMRGVGELWILDVRLRLEEGDGDVEGAVEQWSCGFGIEKGSERGELRFTNCTMGFVQGKKGEREGLVSVTVGVEGRERLMGIVGRAKEEGVWNQRGWIELAGVRWYVVLKEREELRARI